MIMVHRVEPDAPPELAFTKLELYSLDELAPDKPGMKPPMYALTLYLTKLARLDGYLARAHDPPPGNMVVWRGLSRLTDIELGVIIGAQLGGN